MKQTRSPEEKLPILREMLQAIPKHKGTEKLQADIKRRISKIQDATEQLHRAHGHAYPFHMHHEGAGQAALVEALSHAHPVVADFPFSTTLPIPGMVPYEDTQTQLIDAPPLVRDALPAGIINLYRNADLIVLAADLTTDAPVSEAREILQILEEHRSLPFPTSKRISQPVKQRGSAAELSSSRPMRTKPVRSTGSTTFPRHWHRLK